MFSPRVGRKRNGHDKKKEEKLPSDITELMFVYISGFNVYTEQTHHLHGDKEKEHVAYVVTIETDRDKWNVFRRFQDFVKMHQKLEKETLIKECKKSLPKLPTIDWNENELDNIPPKIVLNRRRRQLEEYLHKLVEMGDVIKRVKPFIYFAVHEKVYAIRTRSGRWTKMADRESDPRKIRSAETKVRHNKRDKNNAVPHTVTHRAMNTKTSLNALHTSGSNNSLTLSPKQQERRGSHDETTSNTRGKANSPWEGAAGSVVVGSSLIRREGNRAQSYDNLIQNNNNDDEEEEKEKEEEEEEEEKTYIRGASIILKKYHSGDDFRRAQATPEEEGNNDEDWEMMEFSLTLSRRNNQLHIPLSSPSSTHRHHGKNKNNSTLNSSVIIHNDFNNTIIKDNDNDGELLESGTVRMGSGTTCTSPNSSPSSHERPLFNIADLYREPERWEQNLVALDKGEWSPGMSDAAFGRYKARERPRLYSFFDSEKKIATTVQRMLDK